MKTNFTYTFRNISKKKINSSITIFGLSIAVACCTLIYFFVSQEYSFDNFHKNADRIFRINYDVKYPAYSDKNVCVEAKVADLIKEKIPQIDKSTEFRFAYTQILEFNNSNYEVDMSYADKDFFDIFSFDLLAGSFKNIFNTADDIVITRNTANKLLNKNINNFSELIDKPVKFPLAYQDRSFVIKAIIDDLPRNSSMHFNGIIPGDENGRNFGMCGNDFGLSSVFYMTKENTSTEVVEQSVKSLLLEYYNPKIKSLQEENELVSSDDAFVPYTLPLREIYFADGVDTCSLLSSNKKNSSILIVIGILILIIACSNYTILTLGEYLKKLGDVNVRKTMGAKKWNIFSLFFSEGFMLSFIAFLLGYIICIILFPLFNKLSPTQIFVELISLKKTLVFVFSLLTAITILTSVLPVLVFSLTNPKQLTGKSLNLGKKGFVSQVFVSLQYSLSIILIIVTIFLTRQFNYMKHKSLGLSSENIITIDVENMGNEQRLLLRDKLKEHSGTVNLSLCSRDFIDGGSIATNINKGDGEQIEVSLFKADDEYIPTLDLKLLYGENFTTSNITRNDRAVIVNEEFIKGFNIEENPIGKTYRVGNIDFSIIGVVNNYHFKDVRRKIEPAMLYARDHFANPYNFLLIKFQPEQLSGLLEHLKKSYNEIMPDRNLNYGFWDNKLENRYEAEERWAKIVGYASAIAIIISSLGLFGLTILLINQRIKEIGVRKVNGARISEVLTTIVKPFILWLIFSILLATPIAYVIVSKWLNNFAFRIDISWWIFAAAGSMILFIALATVSWQSWRAASRNPVEALRYE